MKEGGPALFEGFTLLLLEVPKANDKKELAAEAMFAALHGILKPRVGMFARAPIQERISF